MRYFGQHIMIRAVIMCVFLCLPILFFHIYPCKLKDATTICPDKQKKKELRLR